MKTITLTPEQLEDLLSGEENVKGFEGWEADADHDSGDFDSEKGAMIDYKITLYDPVNDETWTARDGYYTGVTGDVFNWNVEFNLKSKKVKNKTLSEDKIKDKLNKLLEKSDIKTIYNCLKEIKENK